MKPIVIMVIACALYALVAMLSGFSLTKALRSDSVRSAGRLGLHLAHFDAEVHPSRSVRRSILKGLKSLWMTPDESQIATAATVDGDLRFESTGRTVNVFDRLGNLVKVMPAFAGGDTTTEDRALTLEDLAGLSAETLRSKQGEELSRAEALIDKQTSDGFDRDRHKEIKLRTQNLVIYKEAIAEREGDTEAISQIKAMRAADDARKEALRTQSRPEVYGAEGDLILAEFKTPGEFFTDSAQYADFKKRGAKGDSDVVPYVEASKMMGLRTGTDKLKMRAMRAPVTSQTGSAGTLTQPQFLGLQERIENRTLTIRDLVTVLPTDSDAIEYVKESTRTSNATVVPEAAQIAHTGDTAATKPEGGLTFSIVTDTVKLIAEWVAVTTKILADAPQLRAYIDEYLLDDLALELEDQMVAGSGAGENFTGILNTAGIQTVGPYAAGSGPLENIRKAKTLVRKNGRTRRPLALVVAPEDSQLLDLLKENNEANNFAGSGPFAYRENEPIWAMPRIESEAIPVGAAVVGDFSRAVLYDRQQAQISVGTVGDDFIRNLRRILAEGRWGFGVRRPAAFCEVDLTAAV